MREAIIHRPLVPVSAGLILGVLAVSNLFAAILLFGLLIVIRELRSSILVAAAFAAGTVLAPSIERASFDKQFVNTEATVVSVPKLYSTEKVAQIRVGDLKLMMSGPPNLPIGLGDTIVIRGYAKPLAAGSERLADRSIIGRIWVDRVDIRNKGPWILRIGNQWRDSFIQFTDSMLSPRVAAAVGSVCFNVQTRMDESDRDAFSRAGTVHAVSVSGLHVGVLAVLILAVMSLLPIPRGIQIGVVALVLVLYSIASGLHAPIVRASLMSMILSGAYLLRREPDFLSAVALAAIAQLLWDSSALYDAGFQLTFVVLAVVAFFGSRATMAPNTVSGQLWHRVRFHFGRNALVAAAALPVMAYSFGALSIPSLLTNILTVITIPFIVAFAILAHLLSFLSQAIATGMMVLVVEPLSGWLLFITDNFGGEWAQLGVPAFSGYWLLAVYGLLIFVWRIKLRPA